MDNLTKAQLRLLAELLSGCTVFELRGSYTVHHEDRPSWQRRVKWGTVDVLWDAGHIKKQGEDMVLRDDDPSQPHQERERMAKERTLAMMTLKGPARLVSASNPLGLPLPDDEEKAK